MNSSETLVVSADRPTAASLLPVLEQHGAVHHSSAKRNIDGETATWIVAATLSGQALPHVLTFLSGVVGNGRVKKIKVGDWEVENPTKRDLELFRQITLKSLDDDRGGQEPD